MKWPLARVMEHIPGRDEVCRVAFLKIATRTIKSAVAKLCLQPFKDVLQGYMELRRIPVNSIFVAPLIGFLFWLPTKVYVASKTPLECFRGKRSKTFTDYLSCLHTSLKPNSTLRDSRMCFEATFEATYRQRATDAPLQRNHYNDKEKMMNIQVLNWKYAHIQIIVGGWKREIRLLPFASL